MDAVEFMRRMSSQAAHDNPVPKTKLGFIDYEFDPTTYPQTLPKVIIDGQGMSDRGYQCLNTYHPIPGDRVLMLPVGIAYVILGAVDRTDRGRLLPGTYVLGLGKTTTANQTLPANTDTAVIWDTEYQDLVAGWSLDTNPTRFTPQVPGWYRMSGHIRINNFDSNNGEIGTVWYQNGSSVAASRTQASTITGEHASLPASTMTIYMNGTTDYLELRGRADTATTIDFASDTSYSCRMEAEYAGDGNNELHRLDRS